jgi:hypothetical protein
VVRNLDVDARSQHATRDDNVIVESPDALANQYVRIFFERK